MRKYDYSFLEKEAIPSNIASYLFAIERNKNLSETFKTNYPKVFTNLVKIAKVQSVKASNAIEGIVTTDKRIESIVNKDTEPLNHDEKEIAGYRDALEDMDIPMAYMEKTNLITSASSSTIRYFSGSSSSIS